MSIWSDTPELVRVLGQLLLDGHDSTQTAAVLTRRYGSEFTKDMVVGKIRRQKTHAQLSELFSEAQVANIYSRFSYSYFAGETEGDVQGEQQESREPADDGLGPLIRPRTCQVIVDDDGEHCGGKVVRGSCCADHARVCYKRRSATAKQLEYADY